jgi:hypothetical protein
MPGPGASPPGAAPKTAGAPAGTDEFRWPDSAPPPPPVTVKAELVARLSDSRASGSRTETRSSAESSAATVGVEAGSPKAPQPHAKPTRPEFRVEEPVRKAEQAPAPAAHAAESSAQATGEAVSAPSWKAEGLKPAEKKPEPPRPFAGRPAVVVSSKATGASGPDPGARPARSLKKTIVGGLEGPAPAIPGSRTAEPRQPPRAAAPRAESTALEGEDLGLPEWTVAINDRDHTEMSTRQLVELYAIGAVTHETFVWKPGMETWKKPFGIPPIAAALESRGFKRPAEPSSPVAGSRELKGMGLDQPPPIPQDEEATIIHRPNTRDFADRSGWREPGKVRLHIATPPRPGGTPATRTPLGFSDTENADEVTVAADTRKFLGNLDAPPSSGRALRSYTEDAQSGDVATVAQGNKGGKGARRAEPSPQASERNELSHPTSYDEPTVLRPPDAPLPVDFDDSELPKPVIPQPLPSEDQTERRSPSEMAEYARNLAEQRAREHAQAGSGKAGGLSSEDAPERLLDSTDESPSRSGVGPWLWSVLILLVGALAAIYFFRPDLISRWVPTLAPKPPEALPEVPAPQASRAIAPGGSPGSSASAAARASETDAGGALDTEAAPAGPFNKKAAWGALGVVANGLSRCAAPEAEPVTGDVLVTFVPSGKVSFVEVKGDLKGSPMEGCVAQAFRRVTVPRFSGDPVHLARGVSVP